MATTRCAKCGGIVRTDYSSCPACGAAQSASSSPFVPGKPSVPRREDLEIEIRSRLMWGESPEAVRSDFIQKGVRSGELDTLLNRAVQDRKAYYRKQGVKNMLLGAGLLALGIVILLATDDAAKEGRARISGRIVILGIAAPAGGLLLLFKGIRRISRPGAGERLSGDLGRDD